MSARQVKRTGSKWLQKVQSVCAERGLLLTPLRSQVMQLLAESEAPLGAYQVLDELSKTQGKSVGPPTAYRALDFLVENGFAFKIVSRNAYVRCEHLGHDHHGALLICSECGLASEIESPELDKAIHGITSKAKFRAQRQTVEVEGVCARCRAD